MFGSVTKGMDVVKKVIACARGFGLFVCTAGAVTGYWLSCYFDHWLLPSSQIEGYGSSSGKTSKKIVVDDCGQLA